MNIPPPYFVSPPLQMKMSSHDEQNEENRLSIFTTSNLSNQSTMGATVGTSTNAWSPCCQTEHKSKSFFSFSQSGDQNTLDFQILIFRKRAETSFQKFDIFLFFQNFALASLAQEFFQTFPPPYYLNPKTCHSRGGGDIYFNCLDSFFLRFQSLLLSLQYLEM